MSVMLPPTFAQLVWSACSTVEELNTCIYIFNAGLSLAIAAFYMELMRFLGASLLS